SQQPSLNPGASSRARQRRSGTTESPRTVRIRTVQVLPGRPGNNPKPSMSNIRLRCLRLVGGGGSPAQKVWRLSMDRPEAAMKMPALAGALLLFCAARTLFALIGLSVVLATGLPVPREFLLRQFALWGDAWNAQ